MTPKYTLEDITVYGQLNLYRLLNRLNELAEGQEATKLRWKEPIEVTISSMHDGHARSSLTGECPSCETTSPKEICGASTGRQLVCANEVPCKKHRTPTDSPKVQTINFITPRSPKETWEEKDFPWMRRFAETKFAKGGGLSFECSDFEGMYEDMMRFVAQEKEASRKEGYEAGKAELYKTVMTAQEAHEEGRKEVIEEVRGELALVPRSHFPGYVNPYYEKAIIEIILTRLEKKV